jgi:hypothetical protein
MAEANITVTAAAGFIPGIWDPKLLALTAPSDELMARFWGVSLKTYRRWKRDWETEDDCCAECGWPYDDG